MLRALRQEDDPYSKIQAFPGQRQMKLEAVSSAVQFRQQMEEGGGPKKVEDSEFCPSITIETGVRSASPPWEYESKLVPGLGGFARPGSRAG